MYLAKSIAASGLRNQQLRIDTLANNVANANTVAFKNARLDFKDSLYTAGVTPGPARTPDGTQQKGHGVMLTAVTRDFKPGNLERTERQLDFAIEGEGFFSIADANGDLLYTRNGTFHFSVEPGGTFLVNGEGLYVLDPNGARITIPFGTSQIDADTNGNLRFTNNDELLGVSAFGLFTFRNLKGLEVTGHGNYAQTAASGDRTPAANAVIRQGMVEGSNLNMSEEMTRLIRTQRAFQLASRALTTADDMEGIANNMRR